MENRYAKSEVGIMGNRTLEINLAVQKTNSAENRKTIFDIVREQMYRKVYLNKPSGDRKTIFEIVSEVNDGEKLIFDLVTDTYPEGYISHRKDGDYQKRSGEWFWIKRNPDPSNNNYPPGSMFVNKKKLPVRTSRGEGWYIPEGEEVTDIEVIAKSHGIKNIEFYKRQVFELLNIQTKTEDWTKHMGLTFMTDGKEIRFIEIHWYSVKNIGKIWFKEKIETED